MGPMSENRHSWVKWLKMVTVKNRNLNNGNLKNHNLKNCNLKNHNLKNW